MQVVTTNKLSPAAGGLRNWTRYICTSVRWCILIFQASQKAAAQHYYCSPAAFVAHSFSYKENGTTDCYGIFGEVASRNRELPVNLIRRQYVKLRERDLTGKQHVSRRSIPIGASERTFLTEEHYVLHMVASVRRGVDTGSILESLPLWCAGRLH